MYVPHHIQYTFKLYPSKINIFIDNKFSYFEVKLICVCLIFAYRKNSLFTLR